MHHGTARTLQGIKSTGDELGAGLGEYLKGDIGWYAILLDELAAEVEVGLAGGWKADLDFFKTNGHEQIKEALLLCDVHGLCQCLITVAQVHSTPGGGLGDDTVWPAPCGAINGSERAVFAMVKAHGGLSLVFFNKPPRVAALLE